MFVKQMKRLLSICFPPVKQFKIYGNLMDDFQIHNCRFLFLQKYSNGVILKSKTIKFLTNDFITVTKYSTHKCFARSPPGVLRPEMNSLCFTDVLKR